MQGPALFGDRADTANTGADANADALAVIVGNFETGVADRLFGGRNTVMNKRIGALDVLDAQPLLGVEVPDHATEPGGIGRHVEIRDRSDTGPPRSDVAPGRGDIVAHRGHDSQAGDDHAPTAHQQYLINGETGAFSTAAARAP